MLTPLTLPKINALVDQFKQHTLPKEEWTHKAHLIVALWHNWHLDFDVALSAVRNGIKTYNEAVGTPNTATSGYHETLTIFWMIYTKNALIQINADTLEDACNLFLTQVQKASDIPLYYYSKQLLFSEKSRKSWQEGDLKRLEQL